MGAGKALGVLGGMGTRATWRFCQLLTDEFNAEKEWDHPSLQVWLEPQIPSRTRALLYGEETPEQELTDCLTHMHSAGIRYVAVPCNSVHLWRSSVLHRLAWQHLIQQLTWIDMIAVVKRSIPARTLVVGGYATMKRKLYGPEMDYATDEYEQIAEILEWLRKGESANVEIALLLIQLESKYHPPCILLGCTEFALRTEYRQRTIAPVLDSSELYAKGVAALWNRLSSS